MIILLRERFTLSKVGFFVIFICLFVSVEAYNALIWHGYVFFLISKNSYLWAIADVPALLKSFVVDPLFAKKFSTTESLRLCIKVCLIDD